MPQGGYGKILTVQVEKMPRFLKKYFWDADFKKISVTKNSQDLVARILEYGDEKAIRWMRKKFSKQEVAKLLSGSRAVTPRSANFWALIFNLDKRNILCLQKPYLEIRKKHWPY